MKPAAFDYEAPTTLEAALAILAEHDGETKVLAGGQSLVPLMNFRLARPELVVDIGRIPGLSYVRRERGELRIGALTLHTQVEHSPLVQQYWPLIAEAAQHIGHAQIRNAGTVGGSLAHADPAAELPTAMAALDATMVVASRGTVRRVPCSEFFVGPLETVLRSDELLVEVVVPAMPASSGTSFVEYARRSGDFALGGAAVRVAVDDDGRCVSSAIALLGVGATPLRRPEAEQLLAGSRISPELVQAVAAAARDGIDPTGDIHASGQYRRDLTESLAARGIATAAERALRGRPAC